MLQLLHLDSAGGLQSIPWPVSHPRGSGFGIQTFHREGSQQNFRTEITANWHFKTTVTNFRELLKIQKNDAQIFALKRTKMRLAAGLPPDPLGSLQRSPDPVAGFKGTGAEGIRGRKGRGNKKEGMRTVA